MRVEVYHQSAPNHRALLSLKDGASLDDLFKAIEERLGIRPEGVCLGETQAQIVNISDIQNGDSIRVTRPALPSSIQGDQLPDTSSDADGSSPFRQIIKVILTLVIFVLLESVFQRLVYMPIFHGDPDDFKDAAKWAEGHHHRVDQAR